METNALNPNTKPNTFRGREDIHRTMNRGRINTLHAETHRAHLLEWFRVHFHRFADEITKSHHEFHRLKPNWHVINQHQVLLRGPTTFAPQVAALTDTTS